MILLAIASCLLFFITYFTGIYTEHLLKKFLPVNFTANFFEVFLLGLMACYVYFNLLSFFVPVNYITLLPLLLISASVFSKKNIRQDFFTRTGRVARLFFSKKNLPFIIPFIALLFLYWIIPPQNIDSGEYHYIAIRWYEQFKIVPGLANVHGRLAFNPASFIISAAWSFTDITGQSLYPLNGVLVLLFFTWLIKKVLVKNFTILRLTILILIILLFRISLVNVSSPSSDLLSGILLFYCGFRTYELIKEGKNDFGDYFPVLAFACFAVTAKLSAIPALLIIPFIYFILIKKNKQFGIILKCLILAALLMLPWLVRNFLLSGYLLYPIPATGFFKADWKVPHNVIQLDYIFTRYGPRTITVDFFTMQKMNLFQLTKVWFDYLAANSLSSLLITFASFLSPVVWLFFPLLKKRIPVKSFLLWCIYYFCICIWLLNSPEHRFGLPYLALAAGLPLLEIIQTIPLQWKISPVIFFAVFWICCWHYAADVLKRNAMYSFSIHDCWLKPLRDRRYFTKNNLSDFPSVNLGNGVKLYLADKNHECLNANGPCMNWRYGEIEMRGTKIEEGFRSKKDEVKLFFPFVDANE